MIRRGLSMAMIMVLATLALAVPGAAARPAPNAEVVPQFWLVAHLNDPDVRGIVAIRDGVDADNWTYFTLIGLRAGANHRIVLSGHPCGQPAAPASSHGFTANSKGERSAAYKVILEDILISSLRSVRVRVHKSGGYQTVACVPLRLYDLIDQQGSTAALRDAHAHPGRRGTRGGHAPDHLPEAGSQGHHRPRQCGQ